MSDKVEEIKEAISKLTIEEVNELAEKLKDILKLDEDI